MVTKAISKRVNRSLWGGHFVIGPVLFPAVSSRKRPAQALRWLSITMCVRGEVEDVQDFSALYRLVEEREMERLMKEIVEGWQEMEGKAKVVYMGGRSGM